MDERDRTGGRIEREIELGVIGKGRCNGIHKEHIEFLTEKNFIPLKQHHVRECYTSVPFKGWREEKLG